MCGYMGAEIVGVGAWTWVRERGRGCVGAWAWVLGIYPAHGRWWAILVNFISSQIWPEKWMCGRVHVGAVYVITEHGI